MMVDFNNESTITVPAGDIIRVLILQRRNDFIEAVEHYKKLEDTDAGDIFVLRARLHSFFLELDAMLKKRLDKQDYDDLKDKIESDSFEKLIRAFDIINHLLYDIELTKIDNRPNYDTTRVKNENEKRLT